MEILVRACELRGREPQTAAPSWPDAVHRLWRRKSLGYRAQVTTVPPPAGGATGDTGRVEVRRSTRRRRTVSAYRDGDKTIVLLPARFSPAEEKQWVARMLDRLAAREKRLRPSDDGLLERASELSARYLGGAAAPRSVRWVANQNSRWGSCTPGDASIRVSVRLRGMPGWVLDYVLVHELAHLIVAGHGPEFWRLVDAYPRAERARGYLEGAAHAANLGEPDL